MSTPPHPLQLRLFDDGDIFFPALWQAIDAARERVWLEVYIYETDSIGRATLARLVQAARRGCDVRLLCDGFGSWPLPPSFLQPLLEAGGQALIFNPPLWSRGHHGRRIGTPLHRDHRKILLVDGVAFCGGMNIGEEYAGPELGTDMFRDVMLQVEGAPMRDLAALFDESWQLARRAGPPPPHLETEPGARISVTGLNQDLGRDMLDRQVRQLLDGVQHRCFLAIAYFVPPAWFVDALLRARARGVDVRLLTAGRSDIPLAREGGRHVYGRLLRHGVRVYEMDGHLLHAKFLTLDGATSLVGSYNVDGWSSRRNLEVALTVRDAPLAARLEEVFETFRREARPITLSGWHQRPLPRRWLQQALYYVAR